MKHMTSHSEKYARKVFREHIFLVIEGRIFMLLIIGTDFYLAWMLYIMCRSQERTELVFTAIFIVFFYALSLFLFWYLWYRCFGKLVVTSTDITWRCLFMKTRRISVSQCRYVGIESFTQKNVVKDGIEAGFRFVYFSTEPYPYEFRGRIDKLRNTDTFIKFPISSRLCETLCHVIPEPQNRIFVSTCKIIEQKRRRKQRKSVKNKF